MWPTAVLASALCSSAVFLTVVCSSRRWLGMATSKVVEVALSARALRKFGQENHGFRTDGLYPLVFAMCERFANDLSSHTLYQ